MPFSSGKRRGRAKRVDRRLCLTAGRGGAFFGSPGRAGGDAGFGAMPAIGDDCRKLRNPLQPGSHHFVHGLSGNSPPGGEIADVQRRVGELLVQKFQRGRVERGHESDHFAKVGARVTPVPFEFTHAVAAIGHVRIEPAGGEERKRNSVRKSAADRRLPGNTLSICRKCTRFSGCILWRSSS